MLREQAGSYAVLECPTGLPSCSAKVPAQGVTVKQTDVQFSWQAVSYLTVFHRRGSTLVLFVAA